MKDDEIVIYGASDDLVEVDGSIIEEFFYPLDPEKPQFLAFSDGTVLSILYDNDGIWKIRQVAIGKAQYSKKEVVSSDSDEYSDKVTLKGGNIQWVVFGSAFAYKKPLKMTEA